MKRRDVVKALEDAGYILLRDTGKHSMYYNPTTGKVEPVGHGREIPEETAKAIIRRAQRGK